MPQGLNNPTVIVTANDSTLVDKVSQIEQTQQQDAIATEARVNEFNARAAAIVSEINSVQRIVSTPVPIGVITTDYTAIPDDQRIVHTSFQNHTLTMPQPIDLYKRRGIIKNSMRGGLLTVSAKFVTGQNNGMALIVNPILKPGEGLEYLGYFDLSSTESTPAPSDFYLNGTLAAAGTTGKYRLAIIAYNQMQLSVEEMEAEFNTINNLIEQKTSWTQNNW